MKKTLYDVGGRPFYDDDIQTIQDEAQIAALAIYRALGRDCIVSGCTVTATGSTYSVGAGLVYLGGELLRFLGATAVSLPAGLVAGAVAVLDERTYQTGDTKTCIQEQSAVLGAAGAGVPVYPAGGLTLQHLLRAAQWETGDVKWGQLLATNYDATGLGMPGSVAWGWALCNGQNKTADLRGAFAAGYDPDRTDYAAVGATGGEEAHTLGARELPVTSVPRYNGRITFSGGDSNGFAAQDGGPTSFGGSQAHENRPPFYVLAARQWMGF